MYRRMKIFGFTLDSIAKMPVVILKDEDESTTVPIWVSSAEAVLMVTELVRQDISAKSGQKDLLGAILEQMGFEISCVSIDDLDDGVFSTSIILTSDDGEMCVDVKPSEALVTALKYEAPIQVAEHVIDQASVLALQEEDKAAESKERRVVDFLESLNPEDMGKYPM